MKASNRIRIGHAVVASFVFLAMSLGNSIAARASIIATFTSTTTADYAYSSTAVLSTLATSPAVLMGKVTFDPTFFPAGGGLPIVASITLSATSSTAAVAAAGGGTQAGFSGSYTISGIAGFPANSLMVAFTGAVLTVNGGNASLGGNAVITPVGPGFAAISAPESFGLTLSGVVPQPVTVGALGFSSFTGNDASTASATIQQPPVPEPSSLAIAGIGALGLIGYGLRRRKALSA